MAGQKQTVISSSNRVDTMRFVFLLLFSFFIYFTGAQSVVLSNPSSCGLGLELTDNNCPEGSNFSNPDLFAIQVTDMAGTALGTDIYLSEVRLVIAHPWVSDLNISLRSPSGVEVLLSSDNGGAGQNYGDPESGDCNGYATFSFNSCIPVTSGSAPFSGSFMPEESLSHFLDGSDPNGRWQLLICDDIPEDVGTLEYIELVFEPLSCLPAQNPMVLSQDTTTLVIAWEGSTDCSNTWIEWGPPGFQPGTDSFPEGGSLITNVFSPFLLEGMEANTTYDIYIRSFCFLSGNFSPNSCPLTVQTGCRPVLQREVENFNSEETCIPGCGTPCAIEGNWYNESLDDFDWTVWTGPTPTFETGPSGDAENSGNYVYLETSFQSCSAGKVASLRSVCMEFMENADYSCHFSFNYHMYGSQVGFLSLELSRDGGQSWTEVWMAAGDKGNSWKKAWIDLGALNRGDHFQLRFLGRGGAGPKGDIALDNLSFYGAAPVGENYVYFVDRDGDGYGVAEFWQQSCDPQAPPGFAALSGDCDDSNSGVYPAHPEVPCDGLDNNCNGLADDYLLPPLKVAGDTICSGEPVVLCAEGNPERPVFWYASKEGYDLLAFGNCYTPVLPKNTGSQSISYRFYVEESDFTCYSAERTEVIVVVHPVPDLKQAFPAELCRGTTLDLQTLGVEDTRLLEGELSFFGALPLNRENMVAESLISPDSDTVYYAAMVSTNGCRDSIQIPVSINEIPILDFFPANNFELCQGSIESLRAIPSGGTGPYEFRWEAGSIADSLIIAAETPGERQYRLQLNDSKGCSVEDAVLVQTIERIFAVERVVSPVSDCGLADGSIQLKPLGGLPPFHYSWENGRGLSGDSSGINGTFLLSNLPQGAYRFTISDNSPKSCSFVAPFIPVNGPGAVFDPPEIIDVSCAGASDGSICLGKVSGTVSYRWSNGSEEACISGLSPGFYALTVTAGDCESVFEGLEVREPKPLSLNFFEADPRCASELSGSITAFAEGGTGQHDYIWSNGQEGNAITGLGSGSYELTVIDENGCMVSDSILLYAPEALVLEIDSLLPASCENTADGWISVSPVGGTAPYSFIWSDGQITPQAGSLVPGTYRLTVTDNLGCYTDTVFSLPGPQQLVFESVELNPPLCPGDSSGFIAVLISGGSGVYQYLWSNGDTLARAKNLVSGTYHLEVSDVYSCAGLNRTFALEAPERIAVDAVLTAPSCLGSADGAISLNISGNAPLELSWEEGPVRNRLAAGTYGVRISDGKGCRLDTFFLLEAPQIFDLDFSLIAPTCYGKSDGLIQANLYRQGDAEPEFYWSDGQRAPTLTDLSAGAYQLTITDENSCIYISDTLLLSSPEPIDLTLLNGSPSTCYGSNTGFLEVQAFGGIPPYRYEWPGTVKKGPVLSGLDAGSYVLQVRDANNCPADTLLSIAEADPVELEIQYVLNEQCPDNIANRMEAVVSGGNPDYTFLWSNGSRDAVQENVPSGDYSLTVTDSDGCVGGSETVKIKSAYEPLRLTESFLEPVSCFGESDGKFRAEVSGGSSRYRFHFSNNQILNTEEPVVTLENLAPGRTYAVTVTDMETGCRVASDPLALKTVLPVRIQSPRIEQADCAGTPGGKIVAAVSGGTPGYDYFWYDELGQLVGETPQLTAAVSGSYSLYVSDSRQCRDSLQNIELSDRYPAIRLVDSLTRVQPVTCKGQANGGIEVYAEGGAGSLSFYWSDGRTGPLRSGLSGGLYDLTLVDSKACSLTVTNLEIPEPKDALELIAETIEVSCYGGRDGSMELSPVGGKAPYRVWLSGSLVESFDGKTFFRDSLSAGNYNIVVSDSLNCQISATLSVLQPDPVRIRFEPDAETGIKADVEGGRPDYRFLWNTGDTTELIPQAGDGVYALTVTDSYGCTATQQVLFVETEEATIASEDFTVYPNPAADKLYLAWSGSNNLPSNFVLYNVLGQIVVMERLHFQPSGVHQIDTGALPRGVYYLRVSGRFGRQLFFEKVLLR